MMKLFSKKNINWLFDFTLCYRFPRFQRLKEFVAPRQRWLTRAIPKNWCDKDGLMLIFFKECIIHYVEVEKGLRDDVDWTEDLKNGFVSQEYVDSVIDRDSEFRSIYNYFKYQRPELEKALDNAYPEVKCILDVIKNNTKPCMELYAEVDRIEKEIEENDTWAMTTMIKLRQYMWT